MRSADHGATWADVAYGGASAYGRPDSVALDPEGNGLLLRFPQRLFVTHDDGATWAPMATPGIGAREVRRDGDDRLWLMGDSEAARLNGTGLDVTSARPWPLVRASDPAGGDPRPSRPDWTLLCGDRRVEIAQIGVVGDKKRVLTFGAAGVLRFTPGRGPARDDRPPGPAGAGRR
jgi:hypothetical protein